MRMFNKRLSLSLKRHERTQASLAKMTGLKPAMVNHLVRGIREPSFKTLRTLLMALPDTDARWLITGSPTLSEDDPDLVGNCESCGHQITTSQPYNRDSEGVIWHKRCPKAG